MVYIKGLKSQQVMSPASKLITSTTSQQAPKKDAKDKRKRGITVVKTTKRRWREKNRPRKCINSSYTPFIVSFQASKRSHY